MEDNTWTTNVKDSLDYNRKSSIEENFKTLEKYDDIRFGPVTIIEVPGNNKKIMVREKVFNNKSNLTDEINAADSIYAGSIIL